MERVVVRTMRMRMTRMAKSYEGDIPEMGISMA